MGVAKLMQGGALAPPWKIEKLCEKNEKKKKTSGIKQRIKHKEFILSRLIDLFETTKVTNINFII